VRLRDFFFPAATLGPNFSDILWEMRQDGKTGKDYYEQVEPAGKRQF